VYRGTGLPPEGAKGPQYVSNSAARRLQGGGGGGGGGWRSIGLCSPLYVGGLHSVTSSFKSRVCQVGEASSALPPNRWWGGYIENLSICMDSVCTHTAGETASWTFRLSGRLEKIRKKKGEEGRIQEDGSVHGLPNSAASERENRWGVRCRV